MAKRGRKKQPKILREISPDTLREVLAVLLFAFGLIGLLGILNLAGRAGQDLKQIFVALLGLLGYLLPFFFIFWGIYVFDPDRFKERRRLILGLILGILILSALITPFGGKIGEAIILSLRKVLGGIGTWIFLFFLFIIDVLLTFEVSLKGALSRFKFGGVKPRPSLNVNERGVSVFTTVKRKIGMGPSKEAPHKLSLEAEGWEFPPLDILETSTSKATAGNIAKAVEVIQKTLADFGIEVAMGDVNIGPTVTQYQLKPAEGVKINQIASRSDDLALALASHPIRVEAPIPGKSAVGVEVPNKVRATVTLREVLESDDFKKSPSSLAIALGRDVSGSPVIVDLQKMPHLLIAGATGSGKSVAINAILLGFLYQNSPRDLRVLLVDPKRVEFTSYTGVPHLLTPVITEVDKTVNILKWAVAEMDRRFKLFSEVGTRNIDVYNQEYKKYPPRSDGTAHEHLPYIVIMIDELADLMAQAANEVEAAIVRLSQLARATGLHLVVATQRPSVDVITGLIKANITSRIAFAVASQVDSRTIIDQAGSEKLLGNGDMLFLGSDLVKPRRIQGVLVSDKEIKAVTDFLKRGGEAQYDPSIAEYRAEGVGVTGGKVKFDDPLYRDAEEVAVRSGKASASLFQRRLRIGYARAARLLDILEEAGVIGPAEGAKPRDVLVDSLEFDRRQALEEQQPQEPK